MDRDLLESISVALQNLQKEQKVLSNKLIKVAEVCKNKFIKVETRINDFEKERFSKFAIIDKKLDNHSEDIEVLKKDEVKLSDDVSKLEAEREQVANKILEIDETLEEIKNKIEVSKMRTDDENFEMESDEKRKPCKYNSRGRCKEQDNCHFFHAETVCKVFKATGVCWKYNCRQRHPKTCWFGNRCFRGKSCSYLHHSSPCDRCEQLCDKRFYCEFCKDSFCDRCTAKDAHLNNIDEWSRA